MALPGRAWHTSRCSHPWNGQHVGPQSAVVEQGYVAVANNNVAYPALSLLPNGRGVIAMTLVGPDYYPSAAYVPISSTAGAGVVSIGWCWRRPAGWVLGVRCIQWCRHESTHRAPALG